MLQQQALAAQQAQGGNSATVNPYSVYPSSANLQQSQQIYQNQLLLSQSQPLGEGTGKDQQTYAYATNPYYVQAQVMAQPHVMQSQEGWGLAAGEANALGKRDASYPDIYNSGYDGYVKDNIAKKLKDD